MNNKHNQLVPPDKQLVQPTNKIHQLVPPTDKQLVPPTNEIHQFVPPTDKQLVPPTNEIQKFVPPTDKQLVPPTNKIKQLVPPTNKNHQVILPTNKPQHLRRRHPRCSRLSSLSLSSRRLHLRRRHSQCSHLSSLSLSSRRLQLRLRHSQCSRLSSLSLSSRRLHLRRRHPQCSRLSSLSLSSVAPTTIVPRPTYEPTNAPTYVPAPLRVTANAPASICPESGTCSRISEGGHPPYQHIRRSCQILKEVVSSATEAELAGTFHNGKEACPIRACLEELGHPQGPTPIVTDNSTAAGIANDTVKQKRLKAMDMRFYWIRDRQGQFHIIWRKGALNRADYFTKHHPAAHHRAIRFAYFHEPKSTSTNYFQCLAKDDSPNPVAQTTPKATSTDEGVCASLRHINPSSVSMGEGVLIPVRNPDITDCYKPASSAVTAGTANRHSSATRQTRRRASKRSHRQQTSS
ncbi:hypothetical protein IV203_002281 [Nitzschia inconspicua]|uniref:Integrase catalytic domain-containing protein n=1 Tax=Nitzschia inconspicua TaxID=303405 RepID=A0A9K3L8Z5_9STRA|nr:hypothetical protein IV203_002281 [Nitzschia inconspicua]